jgi:formate dehydrogenase major subunit
MLEGKGYKAFEAGKKYMPGEKFYYNNRGRALIFGTMGTRPIEKGVKILASHIDSPRLDLKPNPVFEKDGIAQLKTHYYGGVRKYQWVARELALHGDIYRKDGSVVHVTLGEDDNDPIFYISDLLPHLAKDQNARTLKDGIKGEEMKGVFGGIDFLRSVAMGEKPAIGRRVAIVGGGNTAMDACRTAVRLGAEEVFVVYRRTRAEMPAEAIEIKEAEEEGVQFKFLRTPVEITSVDGKVTGVKLQVMELGEPDERGRRRPVAMEGQFEELQLDAVIMAIGQRNDAEGFDALPTTARGTIAANERNFATELAGVFACGDAVNRGAGIAIEAIAGAIEAAKAVHEFLCGRVYEGSETIVSEREVSEKDFADRERLPRAEMPVRDAAERRCDFNEVILGLSEESARAEAKRCLECGCHDYEDCRLIRYAKLLKTDTKRLSGEFHPGFTETRLKAIERNQRKCITCNLCVRVCEEKAKKGILGLVGRGFTTVIKPEFNDSAVLDFCKDCRLCAEFCPTGALRIC